MTDEPVKCPQEFLLPIPATKEEWLKGIDYQIYRLHAFTEISSNKVPDLLDYLHQYIKLEWAKDEEI